MGEALCVLCAACLEGVQELTWKPQQLWDLQAGGLSVGHGDVMSLGHPALPPPSKAPVDPQICSWKICKEEIALLSCTLTIQIIEMNQEIKCKNPTLEKVVLAGFCLVLMPPLPQRF